MNTSKLQAAEDLEWATSMNRIGLQFCGIWSHENNYGWRKFCADVRIPFFVIVIIIVILIPETVAMYKIWGNFMLSVENLYAMMPTIVSLCKFFALWHHKEVIIEMIDLIKFDWMKIKSDSERVVMLRYATTARSITICGYTVITIVLGCYFPPVIFGVVLRTVTNITDTGDRPLIFQSVYCYNAYRTPMYELTNLSQVIAGLFIGFNYTNVSTLFAAIVLHVCAQLENLQTRIEIMVETDTSTFQEMFKSNVEEHQRLIRYTRDLLLFVGLIENSFHLVLLAVVMTFSINLCVQGINIINLMNDPDGSPLRIFFSITYVIWSLFLMFLYSAVGEILISRCDSLTLSVYSCDWFNLTPSRATQLIPMLVRCQRPLQVTVGKFVPLSFPTFASVLKTSAGYISVLLAIND